MKRYKVSIALSVSRGVKADRGKIKRLASAIAGGMMPFTAGMNLSGGEISILITDNRRIRELNRLYRSIDRATDVLSFPMGDDPHHGEEALLKLKPSAAVKEYPADFLFGDVVISVEKARTQAGEFSTGLAGEMARLITHGILHLFGYDHARGGAQAKRMKAKEAELLKGLKRKGLIK